MVACYPTLPTPRGCDLEQIASPLDFFLYLQNKGHELQELKLNDL
jgi:hypothetical protein